MGKMKNLDIIQQETLHAFAQSNFNHIIDMFHLAKANGIAYPKVIGHSVDGFVFQLKLAGTKSRFAGAININDDKPFGESEWYGRILPNGQLSIAPIWKTRNPKLVDSLILWLTAFNEAPTIIAKDQADNTNKCMFCQKQLTNQTSKHIGYGPTCAKSFGLVYKEAE